MTPNKSQILPHAYHLMRERFGHQNWWPGDTDYEICVGAILTQNTAWTNVEKAIRNLKAANCLTVETVGRMPTDSLAQLLKPAGYFNLKAKRLQAFSQVVTNEHRGSLTCLFDAPLAVVRNRLLAIHGIGPETADSILLYAARKPSFVVDAYTQRIFLRHRWISEEITYDELKALCETSLSSPPTNIRNRVDFWNDFHAQIVAVGKDYCRPKNPKCPECPLHCLLPDQTIPANAM